MSPPEGERIGDVAAPGAASPISVFVASWLSGVVSSQDDVNVWDVKDAVQDLVRAARPADVSRLAGPGVPLPEVVLSG